ncbi:MAG TPA: hypothetical protein VGL94_23830 [Ktedonobacteraceae bacterium]
MVIDWPAGKPMPAVSTMPVPNGRHQALKSTHTILLQRACHGNLIWFG